ncbi:two component sensor histidine kinase PhoR [Gluconacetobacter sacchari DSM 12717]|uniref:histidine kinase n=2 Tax=Gluconacetobacter sacchari TaxID=92759 RepID=A0A7W4IC21_9PROT|nr:ATP-binding protein [Gluconacetobacter sacchari]MBB2160052.1 histidine kinase [Gluconacetobacter sacchari]GBQ19992.1 two component sensor histidine kinase PhoR [Gluconacetobacter sacchari DSM 12717]
MSVLAVENIVAALGALAAGALGWRLVVGRRAATLSMAGGDSVHAVPPSATVLSRMFETLDLVPAAILVLDAGGRILHAGPGAWELFGDSLGAIMRHPAALSAVLGLCDGDRAEMDMMLDVPIRRAVRGQFRRISIGPGQSVVLATLQDGSERDALERMRTDFVAYASHELRTPLAALTGFIETLRGPAADDPPAQQRFLEVMAGQAARMQRLLDRLLMLSRVQMIEHRKPRGTVSPATIVARVRDEAAPLLEAGPASLEIDLAPGLPDFAGDADQVVQVLLNLVENAIKYGSAERDRGVTIGLRVRQMVPAALMGVMGAGKVHGVGSGEGSVRQGVAFTVADNGPGIEARHLPRLTERFYRVEGSSTRRTGTGLGLAIVKHIIDRHDGRLTVESRVGHGTAFTVWFPFGDGVSLKRHETVIDTSCPQPADPG